MFLLKKPKLAKNDVYPQIFILKIFNLLKIYIKSIKSFEYNNIKLMIKNLKIV